MPAVDSIPDLSQQPEIKEEESMPEAVINVETEEVIIPTESTLDPVETKETVMEVEPEITIVKETVTPDITPEKPKHNVEEPQQQKKPSQCKIVLRNKFAAQLMRQ